VSDIFVFWTEAIVMMGIFLSSFYIFSKAIKYTAPSSHVILSVLWCLLLSLLFAVQPETMQQSFVIRPLMSLVSIIFILIITKFKLDTVISAYLLALGFSYVFMYISALIAALILFPLLGEPPTDFYIDFDRPLYVLLAILTLALQLFLSYMLFRIRRFRNGFPFLFKGYAVILALMIAGSILSFTTLTTGISEPYYMVSFFVAGILIIGVGIYIWIRRSIKAMQRKWAMENNEVLHRQEVKGLRHDLQLEREINENLRTANHNLKHRLASMEESVVKLIEIGQRTGASAEFESEALLALKDIRNLADDYYAEVSRVKVDTILPSTNIRAIDDLFRLFAERFAANDITFKLKVTGSIVYMTENSIKQGKLETMIGDHLDDALIAVKASENSTRSVMATIGEVGDCYEFTVLDSGIPFEVDTLVRLGTERVTTHANEGGSGVGFMKTFETMRECGASLIITENSGGVFSKSVSIRFDGQNQYIIETYRPSDFPASERYAVI